MAPHQKSRLDLRRSLPLPELMATAQYNRSTGILRASDGSATRELIFVNGELRAAHSNLEDEKLGSWLVGRDLISEDEKALALLSQGATDQPPLGHLLVRRGCIEQDALEHELEDLTVTIVRRAAATLRTLNEFVEGRTSSQPDTIPNLTTPQVILVAARSLSNLEVIRSNLEPLEQVAWPSTSLETLLNEFTLTPQEAFIISRMDGSRSLKGLAAVLPGGENEVLPILYALRMAGIIIVGTASEQTRTFTPDFSSEPPGSGQHISIVDEASLEPSQLSERERIRRLAGECQRMDHYRVLGLEPGAHNNDIRGAWERIQQEFSPDNSSIPHLRDLKPELTTIVDRAREAYEVLADPRSRKRYNTVLRSMQDEVERAKRATRAPRIDPRVRAQLVEANIKRASELIHSGEPYLAIKLLEQACEIERRPDALLQLARLLLRNPLWKNRALKTLRLAIEADPHFVDAWIELAEFWRRRQNPERQRKALERAVAADPDHEKATTMYRQLMGQRELERLLSRARRSQAR
ncbi:MAG: tetratricopeptide repeat protein [Acidobacteria bacterium]|nr:tetratricopeptide repeat protein [Acidobacteriota bacterium]